MEARKESLTNLASKIRNIDGKVVGNDGQLRQAIRNVNKSMPGTFVTPVFGDVSTTLPSTSVGRTNMDSTPPVDTVPGNMAAKNQSFASMFKKPSVSKAA
nr:hypothetical protein [Tanacetum cinerariifolium]